MSTTSLPRLTRHARPARDGGGPGAPPKPDTVPGDTRVGSANIGVMTITLDDASRQLYQLWRSALADGDAELADRLTVVGHALHRARVALDPDTVVPNRSDSARATAAAATSAPGPATTAPALHAEADVYSVDGVAGTIDAEPAEPPATIG